MHHARNSGVLFSTVIFLDAAHLSKMAELDTSDNRCAWQCREFADVYKKSGRPLHILVANAGANFVSKRLTPEGAPLQCQVHILQQS